MLVNGASTSSPGTTRNITTPVWLCSHRPMFTMAVVRSAWYNGSLSCGKRTLPIQNDSSKDHRQYRHCQKPSGSIRQRQAIRPRIRVWSLFVNVRLVSRCDSTTLTLADAEDRAMLESNPSANIGDRCIAGQGLVLCPGRYSSNTLVEKAINSCAHLP